MKKSTMGTLCATGLSVIALAMNPVVAGSKHQERAVGVEVDIFAAAAIASDGTNARIVEAEFESKRDKLIWEIELVDADNREIEVKVDANTGEIIAQEIEDDNKNRIKADLPEILSLAEAINIVNVVAQGPVIEAELESRSEQLIWELKVVGDAKKKYRVDAASGALLP